MLRKDCNGKPTTDSTNSENGSQDSGIHTDQTSLSEMPSQESSSVYQSQESIDQLPEDTPRRKVTNAAGNGADCGGQPGATDDDNDDIVATSQPLATRAINLPGGDNLLSAQTIKGPAAMGADAAPIPASAPPADELAADDGDSIRLGDKIKRILDDALLLKQQECGGDTENTIIVQE